MLGGAPMGDQGLDGGDEGVAVAGAADTHGERLSGVLVDDVQQLQPPATSGLVNWKSSAHTLVRAGGHQALGLVRTDSAAFAALGGAAQALVQPQVPGVLAVDDPALPHEEAMGDLLAPPCRHLRHRVEMPVRAEHVNIVLRSRQNHHLSVEWKYQRAGEVNSVGKKLWEIVRRRKTPLRNPAWYVLAFWRCAR